MLVDIPTKSCQVEAPKNEAWFGLKERKESKIQKEISSTNDVQVKNSECAQNINENGRNSM